MEIEFIIEESLEKSIQSYIKQSTQQNNRLHLNTILVAISQKNIQIHHFLEMISTYLNSSNDSQKSKSAQLFSEILKRKKDFHPTPQQIQYLYQIFLSKILDLSTTSIALKICYQIILIHYNQTIFQLTIQLFQNPKFHPPSHKQITRIHAYKLLEYITSQNNFFINTALKTKIIRLILDATYEERDPRNILIVFKLYKWILQTIDRSLIQPFKQLIFQNLQQYYPIDFVGGEDETQTNIIKIDDLMQLLDDCLTYPIFQQQLIELLKQKMATPPVKQFLGTLKKYIKKLDKGSDKRVLDISLRILQAQFLQQQASYPQLIDYFENYLGCLQRGNYTIKYESYSIIERILEILINRLLQKCNGFVISMIKMMSNNKVSKQITVNYVIWNMIKYYKMYNRQNLTNNLGLLIVCLGNIKDNKGNLDFQLFGLLQIGLNQIYTLNKEIQIRILILKIFLQFNAIKPIKFKFNSKYIEQDVINIIKNHQNQTLKRKSCIDFVIKIKNHPYFQIQLKTYFTSILNHYQNQSQITFQNVQIIIYYHIFNQPKQLSNILKILLPKTNLNMQMHKYINNLLINFLNHIYKQNPYQFISFFSNFGIFEYINESSLRQIYKKMKDLGQQLDYELDEQLQRDIRAGFRCREMNYLMIMIQWIKHNKDKFNEQLQEVWDYISKKYEKIDEKIQQYGLLQKMVAFYRPKQQNYSKLLRIIKLQQLDVAQIKILKQQLQNQTIDYQFLNTLLIKNQNQYPTFKQLLFHHIFQILLNQINKKIHHSKNLQSLFLLLHHSPFQSLLPSTSIQSIISLLLHQIYTYQINTNINILILSLKVINLHFNKIKLQQIQNILIPFIFKKIDIINQVEAVVSLAEILTNISQMEGMIKYKKQVIKILQKKLNHPKRKARQTVIYTINQWYNL